MDNDLQYIGIHAPDSLGLKNEPLWWLTPRPIEEVEQWAELNPNVIFFFINVNQEV